MGRPTSPGIRLSISWAVGLNRRMRRSGPSMTMAICTAPRRLYRSLLARVNSWLRFSSSSLSVASSSLVDCSSSLEVSISSLRLCSSSLADMSSSLLLCSSSRWVPCSSMTAWRYSLVAASSASSSRRRCSLGGRRTEGPGFFTAGAGLGAGAVVRLQTAPEKIWTPRRPTGETQLPD